MQDALQASHVVVVDGELTTGAALPGDWLRSLPPGAYTAARTRLRVRVPAWERHFRRLAQSLALLGGEAVDEVALEGAVRASLRLALRAAGPGAAELMLVLHVSQDWRPGGRGVAVHLSEAAALPPPDAPTPTAAAVLGPPRAQPLAKSSLWVAQRRGLEAARPAECGETLLCSASGALLEGVTSNLFVVQRPAGGGEPRLLTAALADGVLGGITRLLLLEAAAAAGLEVEEAAPQPPPPDAPPEAPVWAEAFVCSAVRGVRPLSHFLWLPPLEAPEGAPPPRPPLWLHDAPGPVTFMLAKALRSAWEDDGSVSGPDLSLD